MHTNDPTVFSHFAEDPQLSSCKAHSLTSNDPRFHAQNIITLVLEPRRQEVKPLMRLRSAIHQDEKTTHSWFRGKGKRLRQPSTGGAGKRYIH